MQQKLHTEKELLAGLANGQRTAIEKIYKQHYRSIANYVLKNGGYEQDAKDICQEAIVVLYEKSKDEQFRLTCKVNTYLYAVARNLWLKQLSSRSDTVSSDNLDFVYEDDIKAHQERELYYQHLEQSLEQLGQPCSTLLKAFYYKNKTMEEIAKLFKYTNANNAKTQKYKCLTRLKKIFYKEPLKIDVE